MSKYSFICNACQNYGTDKCSGCNGQGKGWVPINEELYKKDPQTYTKNLLLAYQD